jgi:endogenous inhibitor of DNA gyrase (YacG/DUF329 family)
MKGDEHMKRFAESHTQGLAHCPICTHTVPAEIDLRGKFPRVMSGQKCPRCGSALDVAAVVQIPEAA